MKRQARIRVCVLLAAVLASVFGVSARAQTNDGSKPPADRAEQLARELLEVTGGSKLGVQVVRQMVTTMRQSNPKIPDEFWDEFVSEIHADDLTELVIPIYTKNLTVEEMEAALRFYRTPEGQSILEKMPTIVRESMATGQAWGQAIAKRVIERLQVWKEAHPGA